MDWNPHYELEGKHAFLSASKSSWINYSESKLIETYNNFYAKEMGTRLHEFAKEAILLGQKLKGDKTTLAMFVNDAIGYRMNPEQVLFYSPNCFGTADAISFKKNLLRIHDLKTGKTPASMNQLEVYDALFCLEYGKEPESIEHELRIYQNNESIIHIPEQERIRQIMNTIINHNKIIEKLKSDWR